MTDVAPPSGRTPPRIGVPAGLFSPLRRPAFPLSDASGRPVEINTTWLLDHAGGQVHLDSQDAPAFRAYLRTHLVDILGTEAVPMADRAWAAHRALVHELAYLIAGAEGGRGHALMDACRAMGKFFLSARFQPDALFRTLRVDGPHTAVIHGVETAIGSVAIAMADGERSADALGTLATAAAVADLGLLDLPRELRDQVRPLSPTEWKELQHHPMLSLWRMRSSGIVAPEAERAVRYHHERWDGSGYPSRLVGIAIPIEARYVAIADAYSALTVARRGKPRLSRGDALREMARSTGQFDPSLLRLLVQLLAGLSEAPQHQPTDDAVA